MSGRALQVIYGAYLVAALVAMGLLVAYLVVPDFRYWAVRKGQEAHYRWMLWEYERRRLPVPEWVRQLQVAEDRELPDERAGG